MEAALTNGWYYYTTRSNHDEYGKKNQLCVVRFYTQSSGRAGILLRYALTQTPTTHPEAWVDGTGAIDFPQLEWSRLHRPKRHMWFFEGIEDESKVRKLYEGYTVRPTTIKVKMRPY